jgi:hypothetical protein
MFGIFKKKKKELVLYDLEGNALEEGDIVLSLRYDMGECKLVKTENGFEYQSLEGDTNMSWLKMIDAATERQKVRKKLTN